MSRCLASSQLRDPAGLGFAELRFIASVQDTFYPSCERAECAEELQQFVKSIYLWESKLCLTNAYPRIDRVWSSANCVTLPGRSADDSRTARCPGADSSCSGRGARRRGTKRSACGHRRPAGGRVEGVRDHLQSERQRTRRLRPQHAIDATPRPTQARTLPGWPPATIQWVPRRTLPWNRGP